MSNFKEYHFYKKGEVDTEMAILKQSQKFYKKKAEELQKRLDKYE